MKNIGLFLLLFFPKVFLGQLQIYLPAEPELVAVPQAWRGHNLGAGAVLSWLENEDFLSQLPVLQPGYIRWPHGNQANNYDWGEGLNDETHFNLKEAAFFADAFGARLQAVVPFGNADADYAAQLVAFCNSTDSFWVQQRALLLGHPSPLDIRVWEIGNEVTTAWGFAWSWIGYQAQIFFRDSSVSYTKRQIDSLYFYGGSFHRAGWVPLVGGLNKRTAILGDLQNVESATDSLVHAVEFPQLDTTFASVDVWVVPFYDSTWAASASQEELYEALTTPSYKLSSAKYHWDQSEVYIYPDGGIPAGAVVLIEYWTVGHDGAFAFLDAMKQADSTIEAGYCTRIATALAEQSSFQDDFRQHTPDFLIEHPYASNFTVPAADLGLYAEMVYAAEIKRMQMLEQQLLWQQRAEDWSLPQVPGLAISEWNIALCDACPTPHPFRGIGGALYTASFWGKMLESAARGELDIRALNHFALLASGDNFLHLFHVNGDSFSMGNEGYAALMLMQTVAEGLVLLDDVQSMPQTLLYAPDSTTFEADAIQLWAGYSAVDSVWRLLLLNLDDTEEHEVEIHLPEGLIADSSSYAVLTGNPDGSQLDFVESSLALTGDVVGWTLPAYSLTQIELGFRQMPVGVKEYPQGKPWGLESVACRGGEIFFRLRTEQSRRFRLCLYGFDGSLLYAEELECSEGFFDGRVSLPLMPSAFLLCLFDEEGGGVSKKVLCME